jgi:hypothetical protein
MLNLIVMSINDNYVNLNYMMLIDVLNKNESMEKTFVYSYQNINVSSLVKMRDKMLVLMMEIDKIVV